MKDDQTRWKERILKIKSENIGVRKQKNSRTSKQIQSCSLGRERKKETSNLYKPLAKPTKKKKEMVQNTHEKCYKEPPSVSLACIWEQQFPNFLSFIWICLFRGFCLYLVWLVLANNIFQENYPLHQGFQINMYQFEETRLPQLLRIDHIPWRKKAYHRGSWFICWDIEQHTGLTVFEFHF